MNQTKIPESTYSRIRTFVLSQTGLRLIAAVAAVSLIGLFVYFRASRNSPVIQIAPITQASNHRLLNLRNTVKNFVLANYKAIIASIVSLLVLVVFLRSGLACRIRSAFSKRRSEEAVLPTLPPLASSEEVAEEKSIRNYIVETIAIIGSIISNNRQNSVICVVILIVLYSLAKFFCLFSKIKSLFAYCIQCIRGLYNRIPRVSAERKRLAEEAAFQRSIDHDEATRQEEVARSALESKITQEEARIQDLCYGGAQVDAGQVEKSEAEIANLKFQLAELTQRHTASWSARYRGLQNPTLA